MNDKTDQEIFYPSKNLIDLFRGFYKHDLNSQLPGSSIPVFFGILYWTNERNFPDKFTLTNETLSTLAHSYNRNLSRERQALIDYRDPTTGQWLIRYKNGTVDQCGTYQINYEYLLSWKPIFNDASNLRQSIVNDASNHVKKDDNLSTLIYNTIEKDNDQPAKYVEIIQLVNKHCGMLWNPTKVKDIKVLKDIAQYEIKDIEYGIDVALENDETIKPPGILVYAQRVIETNKPRPKQELTPEMAEKQQAFHEARVWHNQHADGVWKKMNMMDFVLLEYCNKAITHFDKYGQELVDAVGYDKSYWETVRDNIKGDTQ